MRLFLRSQDIRELEIGLFENEELIFCSTIDVGPEEHLKSVDQVLCESNASLNDIDGVYVVTGPGSFTASRVSITIANAIAFTQEVSVYAIENPDKKTIAELCEKLSDLDLKEQHWAQPFYDRPPQITKAKSS